jgi:hypothetical protein
VARRTYRRLLSVTLARASRTDTIWSAASLDSYSRYRRPQLGFVYMETPAVASESAPRRSWPQPTRAPWRRGVWARARSRKRCMYSAGRSCAGRVPAGTPGVARRRARRGHQRRDRDRRDDAKADHLRGASDRRVLDDRPVLICQHREGRHQIKVGRRARVELQDAAAGLAVDERGPGETLLLKDRPWPQIQRNRK